MGLDQTMKSHSSKQEREMPEENKEVETPEVEDKPQNGDLAERRKELSEAIQQERVERQARAQHRINEILKEERCQLDGIVWVLGPDGKEIKGSNLTLLAMFGGRIAPSIQVVAMD